ncbi:MAG: hypothetical protein QOC84_2202, partial [Bradyrhizobium sp.]|nr:hypothetical protein [Bradyrhizobium sp.]
MRLDNWLRNAIPAACIAFAALTPAFA